MPTVTVFAPLAAKLPLAPTAKFQPPHAQTLFNMGIVKWQGKKDGKGAIQIWEKLLASNPSYPDRPKVQQLLDQVKRETGGGS